MLVLAYLMKRNKWTLEVNDWMVTVPQDIKHSVIKHFLNSSMPSYVKNSKLIRLKIQSNNSSEYSYNSSEILEDPKTKQKLHQTDLGVHETIIKL